MSRPYGAVLGLLVLAAGGVVAYQRHQRNQLSPFSLSEIRAGMPFATLDDQADRGEHRRFSCRTVEAEVRLCELETDGPPGTMRLALDGAGRAMIVQFRVADTTLKMRELARQIAAEWSLVDPRHSQRPRADGTNVTEWKSADRSWSASMVNEALSTIPSVFVLVDERRLARTLGGSPPILSRLSQAGLIDAELVDTAAAPSAPSGDVTGSHMHLHERHALTLRPDGRWTATHLAEVDGQPQSVPPDSGTYHVQGTTVTTSPTEEQPAMEYTISGDTLWIRTAGALAQGKAVTGVDIPQGSGESFLVRQR